MLREKSPTLLLLSGFAFSMIMAQANAAVPAKQPSPERITPNAKPRFEFSVTASALKPGASNLNYVIYNKALPLQSPGWTERELRPAYTAAFALGARYLFPEETDIHLDWTHLSSTTSSSVAAPGSDFFLGPDFEIDPAAIPIRNASGRVKFNYDVINLDAGQSINLNHHVGFRFFGGLSNGYLREQVNVTYAGNVPSGAYAGPFNTRQEVQANFTGIGPRFGVEANYHADSGFGLVGEAAASALIGSLYSKTSYITTSQQLIITYGQTYNYQTIRDQTITQVVPGFDTKVGMSYSHEFSDGKNLMLQLGYEAAVYINAINQYLPGSLVAGATIDTGGIFVATMNHTQSNYGVQGPFLKADFNF